MDLNFDGVFDEKDGKTMKSLSWENDGVLYDHIPGFRPPLICILVEEV